MVNKKRLFVRSSQHSPRQAMMIFTGLGEPEHHNQFNETSEYQTKSSAIDLKSPNNCTDLSDVMEPDELSMTIKENPRPSSSILLNNPEERTPRSKQRYNK